MSTHEADEKAQRFGKVREICLALPEAAEVHQVARHAAFKVRGKSFLYYLDDHHGDGMVAINCKVAPGEHSELARGAPERFHIPAYLGAHGWVGLRIDQPEVDWDEVRALVRFSYRALAPKRLAALVSGA